MVLRVSRCQILYARLFVASFESSGLSNEDLSFILLRLHQQLLSFSSLIINDVFSPYFTHDAPIA